MSIKAFELVPVVERIKLMSEKARTQVRIRRLEVICDLSEIRQLVLTPILKRH
jgi:hypothetical protein